MTFYCTRHDVCILNGIPFLGLPRTKEKIEMAQAYDCIILSPLNVVESIIMYQ